MTDDNVEALENKAIELLQGQKWAQALGVLEELARVRPLSAGMLHNKAACHAMLKQLHEARRDLRQVLQLKPGYERSIALLKEVEREIARMPPGLRRREEARVKEAAGAAEATKPKADGKGQALGKPGAADGKAKAPPATVRFRCGHCRARLEESAALSGRRVPCPACGEPCDVPQPKPRGKTVWIVASWSLAGIVLSGVAAALLLNPDLLGRGKPSAPGGPASRPGPAKARGKAPPSKPGGGNKPVVLPRPVRPASRPATQPATRQATRPIKAAATTKQASRPTSRPVATTRLASRPVTVARPTSRPATTAPVASQPASAPTSGPAPDA